MSIKKSIICLHHQANTCTLSQFLSKNITVHRQVHTFFYDYNNYMSELKLTFYFISVLVQLSIPVDTTVTHQKYINLDITDDPNKFICEICGRRYKQKRGLSRHTRFECGKEPQFCCPYCSYKAKRKNNLQSHVLLKHNKPYYL